MVAGGYGVDRILSAYPELMGGPKERQSITGRGLGPRVSSVPQFSGSLAIDTEPQLYYKSYKQYIMAMRFTNVEVVC
jgi:hypothetical protein